MFLGAERLALANRVVKETFEQCSVAWQVIPHWETGDPSQSRVPDGVPSKPGFLNLELEEVPFQITLAQASAQTPDQLLAAAITNTVELAKAVDAKVLDRLRTHAKKSDLQLTGNSFNDFLAVLIDARSAVEDAGYRAPSCLITNTEGLRKLSTVVTGQPVTHMLSAANVSSLHRATKLEDPSVDDQMLMLLLGRRERIPQGGAPAASPGEEPVDLAVSIAPSLDVVGEIASAQIELAVRIRLATRVKDYNAIIAIRELDVVSPHLTRL